MHCIALLLRCIIKCLRQTTVFALQQEFCYDAISERRRANIVTNFAKRSINVIFNEGQVIIISNYASY
jgi:hypothetical protein